MKLDRETSIFKFIENSDTPVFVLNNDKIEFVNIAFAKLVGFDDSSNLKNIPINLFFSDFDLLSSLKNKTHIIENKENDDNEEIIIKILTRDMKIRVISISSFDIDPKLNQYIIFCKDVTDSRIKQKNAFKAKMYVDSIFSNLDDGVIVIDNEKKIINVNNGALLYGMEKVAEIVNQTTKNIDFLERDWSDIYNLRIDLKNFENDTKFINSNIRKFIVNELFEVYIIIFHDITTDIFQQKEIKEKNQILKDQFDNMEKELKFAKTIQEKMLPSEFKNVAGLNILTKCYIANSMGGDYFEVIDEIENRAFMGIFDVSGHGVASSLIVMMLKAMLRTINFREIKDSKDIFYYLQKNFNDKIPGKHFVAGIFLVYDKKTSEINFTCGGNYLPLYYNSQENSIKEVGKPGFAIGFIKKPTYSSYTMPLNEGDKILMFTDGIIEAEDKDNNYYSKKRILEHYENNKNFSACFIKDVMYKSLLDYIDGEENQNDDVTIMVVSKDEKVIDFLELNYSEILEYNDDDITSKEVINEQINDLFIKYFEGKEKEEQLILVSNEIVEVIKFVVENRNKKDIDNSIALESVKNNNYLLINVLGFKCSKVKEFLKERKFINNFNYDDDSSIIQMEILI